MITPNRIEQQKIGSALRGRSYTGRTLRQRLMWTCGNLLLFAGIYLLLYVGGLYAQIEYQRLAARGDNDLIVPRAVMNSTQNNTAVSVEQVTPASAGTPDFSVPVLNTGQIASAPPDAAQLAHSSTVERLVIPSIKLDYKVIEVGWSAQKIDGQDVAVWDVAEYAVGQHKGSANPGEGGNVVMAGHVGGYGHVFRDLFYVHPGDQIVLYSDGQQYLYVVSERLIVDEDKATPEQRAANARLIGSTDQEMVTMVTCWPPNGANKFTQRVIVRAVPFAPAPTNMSFGAPALNSIR